MWTKLFIGTVHKKLRKDVVGKRSHSDKTTYPFMSFLKVKSVHGLEATRHGFLRIAYTPQNAVCNAETDERIVIREIDTLGSWQGMLADILQGTMTDIIPFPLPASRAIDRISSTTFASRSNNGKVPENRLSVSIV
jgi:hypothetical protein